MSSPVMIERPHAGGKLELSQAAFLLLKSLRVDHHYPRPQKSAARDELQKHHLIESARPPIARSRSRVPYWRLSPAGIELMDYQESRR